VRLRASGRRHVPGGERRSVEREGGRRRTFDGDSGRHRAAMRRGPAMRRGQRRDGVGMRPGSAMRRPVAGCRRVGGVSAPGRTRTLEAADRDGGSADEFHPQAAVVPVRVHRQAVHRTTGRAPSGPQEAGGLEQVHLAGPGGRVATTASSTPGSLPLIRFMRSYTPVLLVRRAGDRPVAVEHVEAEVGVGREPVALVEGLELRSASRIHFIRRKSSLVSHGSSSRASSRVGRAARLATGSA
jgi:hypothetical protein